MRKILQTGLLAATVMTTAFVPDADRPAKADNPLLQKWEGQYGGVPPFDKVSIADFKPALEAAMAEQLDEINKITSITAIGKLVLFYYRDLVPSNKQPAYGPENYQPV